MKHFIAKPLWVLILLWVWTSSLAGAGLSIADLKAQYREGEFEKIRITLERFLKTSGQAAQPKEKMLAYKYLGVIYAAEPQGYPLAETYFYQLLQLAPNAHLSDLFVSSAVEAVFVKTQQRFLKERRDNTELDEFGNPRATPHPGEVTATPARRDTLAGPAASGARDPVVPMKPRLKQRNRTRIWPWIVGVGAVGAVTGGYLWYSTQDRKKSGSGPTVDGGGV